MLTPNLDQKAMLQHDGPRLLPASLYVLIERLLEGQPSLGRAKKIRPALLSDSEVLTLAILAQWPRFRSERDFWRFAQAHLRIYFPTLCSQSQFNLAAYTCGQCLNDRLGRPLRHLADLLV